MSNSRTPTYDELSALCAQMAATLQAITEMSGPMALKSAQAMAAIDLTAYRTQSPDPVYAEAKAMRDAIDHALSSVKMYGAMQRHSAAHKACLAVINRARGEG